MVDSHAHLQLIGDLEKALDRAAKAGVDRIIVPGDTVKSSRRAVEIASTHGGLFPAVGVHPHEAKHLDGAALDELRRMALSGGVVAIGEIGLDYHYDRSPRKTQREAFEAQLELAKELDFPVIVHDRESHDDVLDILRGVGHFSGVFHCFSGGVSFASKVLSLGFYISLAGPVTFKNARAAVEVAEYVPDDRLMVETDSPYLSPHPFRGRRNEPANLQIIVKRIAEIKCAEVTQVAELTRANAASLFGI